MRRIRILAEAAEEAMEPLPGTNLNSKDSAKRTSHPTIFTAFAILSFHSAGPLS